ncbi:MAG TPA: flavodoxin-dependent (E)-4-hydroxy-3-methylbut-2-enyl-diphosphate synthase [Clostridia bacterium]|nr:flavodoxin-dependent (E)-4-hydroxy-3-methylbut-2-enyl-diphosphate synthase [Clostridia bacterium]
MFRKKPTRPVFIGNVQVGGGSSVVVQSMTNTDTRDVDATIDQINELTDVGCEVVRLAVPDLEAASSIRRIKAGVGIPVIADIHFDYRLALESVKNGVDGLRINPGNVGQASKVRAIVDSARERSIPIRIGVNAGSLEGELVEKYGVSARAMVESALKHVDILDKLDYHEIKISVKASSVPLTIEAYRELSRVVDYPLHIGVTEAGTVRSGIVKSAVGIGTLLAEGIGDTIRVSLTGHPRHEITTAYSILSALGLRRRGVELISCPTCGRTRVDLIKIADEAEKRLSKMDLPIKVAVMGCVVNGPGEAREADVGIAGGKGSGVIFRKGKVIRTVPEEDLVEELLKEVEKLKLEVEG